MSNSNIIKLLEQHNYKVIQDNGDNLDIQFVEEFEGVSYYVTDCVNAEMGSVLAFLGN